MHVAKLVLALQVVAAPPDSSTHLPSAILEHANGRVPPRIVATYAPEPPSLDGRLDDSVWMNAVIGAEFTQVTPNDGAKPSERTEIRIVYDRAAIYIAARLFDSEPGGIAGRLGRRDSYTSSDGFSVAIDSYHDHRTAFRFSVNPAGVRSDAVATNDDEDGDHSWEPVWAAATRIDSLGWAVEMRIPFSQLRFSSAPEQVWGINFNRNVFRKGESVRWSWVPNTEQGYASHFGHLLGLRDIPPPRRLELLPYTVGKANYREGGEPGNPFTRDGTYDTSLGVDLKYGLTSGLTLDATINPDFGQVEADPAVVNLSAFETFYAERRPFFVEGADIFRFGAGSGGFVFGAPQLFYSRRVGRPPSRWISEPGVYVDYPMASRIIGAAKVSGKSGGWSLGVLDALTAREYAQVVGLDGAQRTEQVEPVTNYAVVSLRRDMRAGASGIGLLGTSVIRDIPDARFAYLRSSAHTGGLDLFHRFGGNRFVLNGSIAASHVGGDPTSITLTQTSSARYYQRPDQDYVSVDTTATSLTGYAGSVQLGKVSGNWTYGTDIYAYSPGFEVNDAGFETEVDRIFWGMRGQRRWLTPGKVFRDFWISSTFAQSWNFGGTSQGRSAYAGFGGQFLNYWRFNVGSSYSFTTQSDKSTRGGPLMERPSQWNVSGFLGTDYRKPVSAAAATWYARNRYNGWGLETEVELGLRPTGAVTLEISPTYSKTHSMGFYVTQRQDELATTTYGGRYLFSELVQESLDITVRADIAITPSLSVQLWAQPFTASGAYSGFKELAKPGSFEFLRYGVDAGSTISYDRESNTYTVDPDGDGPAQPITLLNPDFSLRSFRSNLVMRWEYSPGSTLFLVWNHARFADSTDPTFRGFDDFGSLLDDPQENTLLIKLTYWINL